MNSKANFWAEMILNVIIIVVAIYFFVEVGTSIPKDRMATLAFSGVAIMSTINTLWRYRNGFK